MTAAVFRSQKAFQNALLASIAVHVGLIVLIAAAPSLPKSSRKGMIHYVTFNLGSPSGGSGGAGGPGGGPAKQATAPAPSKRETLKDLTVAQKLEPESKSGLRHPVDKPRKETKPKPEKKTAISKPPANLSAKTQKTEEAGGTESGQGSGGSGSGLKIGGLGSGSGSGSGLADQIGLSNFPYQYYLEIIMDRVSGSWFTSLVTPNLSGNFQTTVFFKIYKNGSISDLKVEESSGVQSLDLSALRAVQNASPFPPLPKEYEDAFLGIHLIFEHTK